jgi:membrane fusion protein
VTLFRKEALEYRADRLHGEISLALPLSWQIIGFTLLGALAAALLLLSLATYARVETVRGAVALDRGVAPVVPTRPGIVTAVKVRDGQRVSAGAPLVEIRAEESLAAGGTGPARVLEALDRQEAELARQGGDLGSAAAAERHRISAEIRGLAGELQSLDRQMDVQRDLVASAQKEVDLVQEVARRGYISRRDLLAREEILLSRRQRMAQLEELRSGKTSALAEAQWRIAQTRAEAGARKAGLSSTRAELAQKRAETQAGRGYSLTAPLSGRVTALTARPGQALGGQERLMSILPDGAVPRAELHVPTSAAGFLQVGQEVRVAVDAFPYQRFGTVPGRIAAISTATVPAKDEAGTEMPAYLVSVALDRPWVSAFGKRQPLLPGMRLTARIVTDERTLFEWLFEPLLAVRGR